MTTSPRRRSPPILTFPCRLEPDPFGFLSGASYVPTLRVGRSGAFGTGFMPWSAKSGRSLHTLSSVERRFSFEAIVDPDVLDIREQYPLIDSARLQKYLDDPSLRFPRNMVPTADFVLTLRSRDDDTLAYRVICVKRFVDLGKADVQRRLEREREFCDERGWDWRLFTDREISAMRWQTARAISQICAHEDLDALRAEALLRVALVRKHADGRSFRDLKRSVARSLQVSETRVGTLVAAMAMHGFIAFDLESVLSESQPLNLLDDDDAQTRRRRN